MPVRIVAGPNGHKTVLVGEDGEPLAAGISSGDGQDALANALAAAIVNAALTASCPPESPTLMALMAREIEAFRGSALGSGDAETGAQFLQRLGFVPSAAEYFREAFGAAAARPEFAKVKAGYLSLAPEDNEMAKPFRVTAPGNVWIPRRQWVQGRKVSLDDDGFAIIGNAVLATYLAQIPRRRRLHERIRSGSEPAQLGEIDKERQEVGERCELRDLLDFEGVLEDALGGPFAIDGEYPPESLTEVYRRWELALQSAESFAMVAIKDVAFQSEVALPGGLRSALADLNHGERRTPLARLGPCPITRELRSFVINYFRERRTESQLRSAVPRKAGGPLAGRERAREKKARTILEAIYQRDPEARLTKNCAHALLAPYFPAEKARSRIWGLVEAPNWKLSGKPPNNQRWTDEDLIATRLQQALK